jgi:hypothetical protein
MPQSWSRGDAKKFAKQARRNTTYYTINEHATNLGAYEDARTYSEHIFTRHAPITGNLMTDGGTSAEGLCLRFGPVYDTPPKGLRNLDGPAPQVRAPLGDNYEGDLDEAELCGLEKHVRDGSDPKKRRPLSGWRV